MIKDSTKNISQDLALQIFLTIYHGTLIGTFFYDYIIRNSVRLYVSGLQWQYVANVGLGILFCCVLIWVILSVWSKIRSNLLISFVVLIFIFVIRLAVGIPDTIEKHKGFGQPQYAEELSVFVAQMAVHLLGIIGTWILAKRSS